MDTRWSLPFLRRNRDGPTRTRCGSGRRAEKTCSTKAEKAGGEGGRGNQERLVGKGNESNERQGSSQAEQHFRKKLLEDKRFTEEVVAFLKVGEAREGIVMSGG